MLIECRIAKEKSQTILKYIIEEFKYNIGKSYDICKFL